MLYLVELTYTSHDAMSLPRKCAQHLTLVQHLQAAGWTLSKADTSFRPTYYTTAPNEAETNPLSNPDEVLEQERVEDDHMEVEEDPMAMETDINLQHHPLDPEPDPLDPPPPRDLHPELPHLSIYVHIILLGIEGTIFRPLDKTLETLGLPQPAITKLLHRLHMHAVTSAQKILRLRRGLEKSRIHLRPLPPHQHDPP